MDVRDAPNVFGAQRHIAHGELFHRGVSCGIEPRCLKRHERIRDKLASKINQIVSGHRNIIVIDISHAKARESDVADAVYGSVQVEYPSRLS